jgi:hypothetical protein|tara:strand:+ start:5077 stop:6681 length:1605 start_codon:yes stop_codon:yes gene_type:complete
MEKDLTKAQQDYAYFLPALSGFYATYVGKQRSNPNYVDPARIPSNFSNGMESLNYLNKQEGEFHYKWTLYSAGHAELDVNKDSPKEDMIRNRDRKNSWMLGDSGGFQIGKGVWEGNWLDPTCSKAMKKRTDVLSWMDSYADYGMILDIPAWVSRSPAGIKATGVSDYQGAVDATRINNDYFIRNRNGNCKFLNVLQGETFQEADDWYMQMRDYCDPIKYPDAHFNGWSMGGQNMCDVHLVLKRLIALRFDGFLEKGVHDYMHFLGTSKLEWAVLLTSIQRAVRKYHNENFTVTFDCASPFLATANGQIYIQTETAPGGKWTYRMLPSVDDKKYSTDTRGFRDAVMQDGIFDKRDSSGNVILTRDFVDSPLTKGLSVKDICIYKPGDLNKIGKEGKTSWDSFSYAIQMGHNVWSHINSVQEANRQADAGNLPHMLVASKLHGKKYRTFEHDFFADIVDDIFATDDRDKAEALIEEYRTYWMDIPGTRGNVGKKTVNATTFFNNLFDDVAAKPEVTGEEFTTDDTAKLEELEDELK